jgi:hypothetical protein
MAISYIPSVTFRPYVDGQDLVRAAGDDGFNVRFQALEQEFKRISEVIEQISDRLDELQNLITHH